MKYDRDEVKRLERELEIDGDNRFRPCRIGEEVPKPKPDLLSIAGQLAEAARRVVNHPTNTQIESLRTQVAAWDAAMKGRE